MTSCDFRVRIFQPAVPEYRVALFERLGKLFQGRVEVWAGPMATGGPSYRLEGVRCEFCHGLLHFGPFIWQRGASLAGLSRGDVVVLCGDIHQLSTIWLAICARLHRIKVVWWGHHWTATSTRLGSAIRLRIASVLADVMLCYTREGIDFVARYGFDKSRIYALGNTIDNTPIDAAISAWNGKLPSFRQSVGIMGRDVILFCSMFRPKTHLELLFEAMRDERLKDVILVAIGDGDMSSEYHAAATRLGVIDRIKWLGMVRDQMSLAPWFLVSKVFVYPGSIGLSLLHSFFYGLPVVTHDNTSAQMPEFEAMSDGETGLLFREGDASDLATKIHSLLNDDARRQQMSETVRSIAIERYSIESAANSFASAIQG